MDSRRRVIALAVVAGLAGLACGDGSTTGIGLWDTIDTGSADVAAPGDGAVADEGQDPGVTPDPGLVEDPGTPDPGTVQDPGAGEDPGADPGTIADPGTDPGASDVPVPEVAVPCNEGGPCDDGDPCTKMDKCSKGVCAGVAYACDDKRPCTDDLCDGHGGCRYPVSEGMCLVNNVCYAAGQASVLSACVQCDPGVSQIAFSVAADDTPCGADDPCLSDGKCEAGQCTAAATGCDDDNPCTDDECAPGTGCVHTPNFDPCDDGDPCTLGDQCHDGACVTGFLPMDCWDDNPCTADLCTVDGCSNQPLTGPCEDGDFCTDGDQCSEGACVPGPVLDCNDNNDCTTDSCHPKKGCVHTLIDSPCCKGSANICDDKDPCTKDVCDPASGACTNTPFVGDCNDGNACTGPDTCDASGVCSGPARSCDDRNTCTIDSCDPKVGCKYQVVAGACDDGNTCTANDACLANGVCTGKPTICDDKNPCTKDACVSGKGCTYEPITGACNDGNACTTGDTCGPSGCVGTAVSCDDGNPCTADSCHPAAGCQHPTVAGPCNDGKDCTINDQCVDGKCVGTIAGLCCTPVFDAPVNKVTALGLGTGGIPGEALNVDGKSTCSPPDNCSNGLDNSLAPLSGIANDQLKAPLEKGEIILLFEHRGFNTSGTAFTVAFHQGKPVDPNCKIQTQSCAYLVDPNAFDSTCQPLYAFKNAKVSGTKLTAGGVGNTYTVDIPISEGVSIKMVLANATLDATLTISGGKPTAMSGILAGAVPKALMIDAIKSIDPTQLPAGISLDMILSLLEFLVVNDIDTDGDGNLDAASVGLKFSAIAGTIAGVKD